MQICANYPASAVWLLRQLYHSLSLSWRLLPGLIDSFHAGRAAEVIVVFHWMAYHFKISLVTQSIMKKNTFKIKCIKGIA